MVTEDDHDSLDRTAVTHTACRSAGHRSRWTGVRAPHVRMSKPIHTTVQSTRGPIAGSKRSRRGRRGLRLGPRARVIAGGRRAAPGPQRRVIASTHSVNASLKARRRSDSSQGQVSPRHLRHQGDPEPGPAGHRTGVRQPGEQQRQGDQEVVVVGGPGRRGTPRASGPRRSPRAAAARDRHGASGRTRTAPRPRPRPPRAPGRATPAPRAGAVRPPGGLVEAVQESSSPWSRKGRVRVKKPAGSGIASAAAPQASTGTRTAAASARHRPANRKSRRTGASSGLSATAAPMTAPAAVHRRRSASSRASGRATAAVTVQLPRRTRCPNGAKPTASPVSPEHRQPAAERHAVQPQRTGPAQRQQGRHRARHQHPQHVRGQQGLRGGGEYRAREVEEVRIVVRGAAGQPGAGGPHDDRVVHPAVRGHTPRVHTPDAASTTTRAAHADPPAGRTNHPEMSLLPVRMNGTLGAARRLRRRTSTPLRPSKMPPMSFGQGDLGRSGIPGNRNRNSSPGTVATVTTPRTGPLWPRPPRPAPNGAGCSSSVAGRWPPWR